MNYTNIKNLLFENKLNNYKYNYINNTFFNNNNNNNIKKYMLDSTYKSINKYLSEKDYVQGFNIYTSYNNYNKSNIIALLMGILGFTVTYRYLKL